MLRSYYCQDRPSGQKPEDWGRRRVNMACKREGPIVWFKEAGCKVASKRQQQQWGLDRCSNKQAEAATTRKFFSFHGHRRRALTTQKCMNTNHYPLYKNSYTGTKLKKKKNQNPMKTVLEAEGTRVFKILFIQ